MVGKPRTSRHATRLGVERLVACCAKAIVCRSRQGSLTRPIVHERRRHIALSDVDIVLRDHAKWSRRVVQESFFGVPTMDMCIHRPRRCCLFDGGVLGSDAILVSGGDSDGSPEVVVIIERRRSPWLTGRSTQSKPRLGGQCRDSVSQRRPKAQRAWSG